MNPKKLLLTVLTIGFAYSMATAQLSVSKQGQVLIGKRATQLGNIPVLVAVDTTATAVFLGNQSLNGGAHISFGASKEVTIGEKASLLSGSRTSTLELYGKQGFTGTSQGGTVFQYLGPASSSRPFIFYTDVRANGVLLDSDSRLKSNVQSLENSAFLLTQISPISYALIARPVENTTSQSAASMSTPNSVSDEDSTPVIPDDRIRYGFMAQEIKEIFPDLVVEGEDGTMAIDYIGFIPLLVDAVKSLQEQVNELTLQNNTQENKRMAMAAGTSTRSDLVASGAKLSQNYPNPFNTLTNISCVVPSTVSEATIFIFNLQGQQVLRLPVEEKGETSVTISSSALQPGMYIYSLIVDGIEIDSKKMILTD